jgi:hypothetical protein
MTKLEKILWRIVPVMIVIFAILFAVNEVLK